MWPFPGAFYALQISGAVLAVVLANTDVTGLAAFGPLGLIVLASMGGLVYYKPTVDRIILERDKAEAQRDAMQGDLMESSRVLEKALVVLTAQEQRDSEIKEVLTDVRRLLEQGKTLS